LAAYFAPATPITAQYKTINSDSVIDFLEAVKDTYSSKIIH